MKVFSMWKFWKVQKTTNLWWVATKKTKIRSPTKTRWWFHPYFLFSSRKLGKMMNPIWRSRRFWQDGVCHWFNHQQTKRSAIFSLTRSIHWNNIEMMWWPLQLGEWWSDWSNLSVGRWWREPGIHFLFDFGWSYVLCKSVWQCWFCYVVVDHYERNMKNRWWKWWNTFFVASLRLRWRQSSSWRHIYGS